MKWKIINFIETTRHKAWVAWYLFKACLALMQRACLHDPSKYSHQEAAYFEQALPALRNLEYGSDEYKAALDSIKPAIEHHYRANSHHPEHYKCGLAEMSPLDLVEMLCDWRAATRRHASGNLVKSIDINTSRFLYSNLTRAGFVRDALEMGLIGPEDILPE